MGTESFRSSPPEGDLKTLGVLAEADIPHCREFVLVGSF